MPDSGSTPASVHLWTALLQVHARIRPELEAELRRATGLPASWYDMLDELARPHRLRMSDLGERMVLSRTRVSRLVTELEGQGLVRRDANPADGRSAYVDITPAGRRRLREATPHRTAVIERRFAELDSAELGALTGVLRKALGDKEFQEAPAPGIATDRPIDASTSDS